MRKYHALPHTREARTLAELTLTHVYKVATTFFENDPNIVDTSGRLNLVDRGDCVIDLCDVPHFLEVNEVRETGAQALLSEYCVYMEPNSSVVNKGPIRS